MPAWVIPAILLATTVATSALAYDQQQKAASAQKKANSIQNQQQDSELRRARIQEIAQARRQRATALSFAEASGVNDVGSSVTGGINSVQSQSAGNQAFLTAQGNYRRAIGRQLDKASNAETQAAKYGLLSSTSQFGLDVYANRSAYGF
jgi:hypothetical protein